MSTASPQSVLASWANEQDSWVRGIVRNAMSTRQAIGEDQLDALFEAFLVEKKLEPGEVQAFPVIAGEGTGRDGEPSFLLVKMDSVENVNMLAPGQHIDFNPRVTVLFGENGAGKTGYVRILKRMASVRSAEEVLPDITKSGGAAGQPRAQVTYRLGDTDYPTVWKNDEGVYPFTRLDVFDARAAVLHVDEELTYVYTPQDLSLFRLVMEAMDGIRSRLERKLEEIRPTGNPFLSRFARESVVYTEIEALGASTDIVAIEKLGTVAREEEEGLEGLRSRVDALRGGAADARLQIARAERELYGAALAALQIHGEFRRDEFRAAVQELSKAEEGVSTATRLAFSTESIPKVLEEAWSTFIQAGEKYIVDAVGDGYPRPTDRCIYCRQELGDAARALILKYRGFCDSELRRQVQAQQAAVDQLGSGVVGLDLEGLTREVVRRVASIGSEGEKPAALEKLEAMLPWLKRFQDGVKTRKFVEDSTSEKATSEAKVVLEAEISGLNQAISDVTAAVTERHRMLEEQSRILRELEARVTLRELFPEVKKHVMRAKWADRAGTILAQFRGLSRSLTDAAKLASEELLNQDFERHFRTECTALRAPRVKLEFPGRKGEAARRKLLSAEHKLSEILSEGEQKVIALADFLAEASMKQSAAPMVLDDPVNSLDYRRLTYVVDRIAEIARGRQVIVFTHNIWFATELLARFERDRGQCSYYDVREGTGCCGIVTGGTHPRADTFSALKGRINNVIQEAERATGETQAALVEQGYDFLRAVTEVVAEEDLLCSVTRRYQRNVMMTKLPKIKADRLPDAIKVIYAVYDKACGCIPSHAQPLEMLSVRPSVEDLKEDWSAVQAARDTYLRK